MDDFPSNSRRPSPPADKSTTPSVETAKLQAVVTGKVVTRKKSLGRRFKETFFNGDSTSVFGYLLKDVFVPALQDLATDIVKQGIERAVYGEVRSPSRSHRGSSLPRTHISYDRQSSIVNRPTYNAVPARRAAVQPSAFQVGEIILPSQIEAQGVVDKLYEVVEEYGLATVANLYELIGQTAAYTDHKWGWTDLQLMTVKRIREGYLLILPDPEDLR